MTNLLHRSDKFTVYNKCSEIPLSTSNILGNSCVNIAFCSSEFIFTLVYAASSIQNASAQSVSCIHLSIANFALRTIPQTKI